MNAVTRAGNWSDDVIIHAVAVRAATTAAPHPRAVVVHLRIGDVLDKSEHSVEEMLAAQLEAESAQPP